MFYFTCNRGLSYRVVVVQCRQRAAVYERHEIPLSRNGGILGTPFIYVFTFYISFVNGSFSLQLLRYSVDAC